MFTLYSTNSVIKRARTFQIRSLEFAEITEFNESSAPFSKTYALLAFIAPSAAQSSAQTHIQSAIVVIDTSNNAWHSQVHWLVGTPYLAIKASNVVAFMSIQYHSE